jgi:stage IV sporulation protein FB
VGQAVALVFGAVGLFSNNMMLMFIALFVFLAAGEERATVQTRASIQGLPVRDGMLTEFRWLDVNDPLGLAVRYLMAGSQTHFPVIENQRPIGVLSSSALIAALSRVGPDALVGTVVERNDATCEAGDPLDGVLARMRASGAGALPVMNLGSLVGLLTLDNAGELLLVRNAIRRYHGDAKA